MPEFKTFNYDSSTGRNSIYARECVPDVEPKAVVQIVHGIADHIDRYDDFMLFLANNGYVAVGEDHLGHGKTIKAPEDQGFFDEKDGWNRVLDDLNSLRCIERRKYPNLPYVFFGHSMGSFLVRNYLINNPDKYDGAIICGTGHQAAAMVIGGYTMASAAVKLYGPHKIGTKLNDIAFGAYNNKYDTVRTPFDWVNSDPEKVDEYIADPFCGFVATVSLFRDMMSGVKNITNQNNIDKMSKTQPVLFIAGKDDPVGEYGAGVERAYKAFCKAGLHDVYMKLYPGARHELLNEPIHETVYNDVLDWLKEKI